MQEKPNSSPAFVNLATAYLYTKHFNHAQKALRTAVEINPLNLNAVIFYSDLSFHVGNAEKAIQCLCTFTKYNQKSVNVWERLARAYYIIGDYGKARDALKHQASIKETSSVWNNLGLVYWKLKDNDRGLKYISLALEKAGENSNSLDAPLMNLFGLLSEMKGYGKAIRISQDLIANYHLPKITQEKLYLKYVIALDGLHKHEEATAEAQRLLLSGIDSSEIRLGLLLHLTYYKTVLENDMAAAHMYVQMSLAEIQANPHMAAELLIRVHNNCMFSLLCFDKIDEAKALIPTLQRAFHKDPYSTATLGLYNLKRHRPEKAAELYSEAIRISGKDRGLKLKIKQRMNLEMGKYYEDTDKTKAIAFLEKAKNITDGYEYVRRDVLALRAKL